MSYTSGRDKIAFILPNIKGPLCLAIESGVHQTSHTLTFPKLELFGQRDLFFSDLTPHYLTGHQNANAFVTEGNGQMSLLLLETLFLSKCLPSATTQATVVYVDAYPGDHIPYLSKMFPAIVFHLYDQRFKNPHKIIASNCIKIHDRSFNDGEATRIKNSQDRVGTLLYISLLRDPGYGKGKSAEQNSDIIDNDMWKQLYWAQVMMPEWSLIRYRPKLDSERPAEREGRPNVSSQLTQEKDPVAKRRLYYNYPVGYFLRPPMAKKNRVDMFLMTCSSQTNNYKPHGTYYHEDVISMCRHQNEYVRRICVYANPLTNTYAALYGLDTVLEYMQRNKLNLPNPERYLCGAGWDHRAMFYIMTMWVRWRDATLPDEQVAKEAIQWILYVLTGMEAGHEEAE